MSKHKLRHLRTNIPGIRPKVSDIEPGQIFINTADHTISILDSNDTVVDIGSKVELSREDDNILTTDSSGKLYVAGFELREGNIDDGEYYNSEYMLSHVFSNMSGSRPTNLAYGQIFLNHQDGTISIDKNGEVIDIGGGGSSGSGNVVSFGSTEPHPAPPLIQNSVIGGGTNFNNPTSVNSLVALGSGTNCGTQGVAIGAESVGGRASVTIGYQTTGVNDTIAIGSLASAKASEAIAIGWNTNVSDLGSRGIAVGIRAEVSNWDSIAIGSSSKATGTLNQFAVAIGCNSSVRAPRGIAIGYRASSTHATSIAIGSESTTIVDNQLSVGKFVSVQGSPDEYTLELAREIVGLAAPTRADSATTKAYVDHTKIFSATLAQMLTEVESGSLYVPTDLTATNVLDVPVDAEVKIGHRVDIVGPVEIVPEVGVTIRSVDNKKKVVANQAASLIKIAANEFVLIGSLED